MSKVQAEMKPKGKGKLKRIVIERAKNGVTIQKHHESGGGEMMYHRPDEPPSVFTKASQAHAHVKEGMGQMFGGSPADEGEEAGEKEGS